MDPPAPRYYVSLLGPLGDGFIQRMFVGLPPALTGGVDDRQPMPRPRFLVIDAEVPDSVNLYRYADDGSFAGGTWHQEIEHAWEQAAFEYGDAVGEWLEVPPRVTDPVAYARSLVRG